MWSVAQASFEKLQTAFNGALESAKSQIEDLVGRTMRVFSDPEVLQAFGGPRATSLRSRPPAAAFLEEAQLPTGSVAADAPSVRVKVVPALPPDPVLKAKITEVISVVAADGS